MTQGQLAATLFHSLETKSCYQMMSCYPTCELPVVLLVEHEGKETVSTIEVTRKETNYALRADMTEERNSLKK
jgi:hypothetical protein